MCALIRLCGSEHLLYRNRTVLDEGGFIVD